MVVIIENRNDEDWEVARVRKKKEKERRAFTG